MKDREIAKLRFSSGSNRPYEFEKWLNLVSTTLNGMHPEIGGYGEQVVDSSTEAYQKYLRDVSYTRVKIMPNEALARNTIEQRIEARLLTMLNYVLPSGIVRQCDDRETVTCAFIMYRTLVYAGPASKDD